MQDSLLEGIADADRRLTERFADRLVVNQDLDRTLVSFQANKAEQEHRWCKYKEGFSAALMRYVFQAVGLQRGRILDPFAGAGTALFAASECGLDATGIELLPSSAEIIEVRRLIFAADRRRLAQHLRQFGILRVWESSGLQKPLSQLRITAGAYPAEAQRLLERYLHEAEQIDDEHVARVLRFAALCVLESISYTRKDGQYLRWDARSNRRQGARFDKGQIWEFSAAITRKLTEIAADLERGAEQGRAGEDTRPRGDIELLPGSCLDLLPNLPDSSFDGLVTSPPYCNRYDYTRTYALELALLGVDEPTIRQLRQQLLSCTVENRAKESLGATFGQTSYRCGCEAFESQHLLQQIIRYLEQCRADGSLNNEGIPRMVRNYFLELAVLIADWARLLKPGAPAVMVNDNVRYQGVQVPVDLILADFAERAGFAVETIWVLPRGKGNSSQQMGVHGRTELRKCVYVWRRKARVPG